MNHSYYILKGQTPTLARDVLHWAEWFETANRIVKQTVFANGTRVSTVFLGIDHSFSNGPPLLFETMVFGGPYHGEEDRYTTWDEAEAGHAAIVARLSQGMDS